MDKTYHLTGSEQPGKVMVKLDYKQIEMHILAAYMQDPTFDRWLASGNAHRAVAQELWGDGEKYYARGKVYNFATVYGQGDAARAKSLGCTLAESKQYRQEYNARMPGHHRLLKRVERLLERDGYVKNWFGREYYLPPELAYKGVNYLCQGSGGDYVKQKLPATRELRRQMGIDVLNTTHDDIVIELDEANTCHLLEFIAALRTSPFGRELDLDADYSRTSLVDLHPLDELLAAA